MSYIFGHYRAFEIKHLGKPDEHGIEFAPCEKKLRVIEVIVDVCIFGVAIYHLSCMTLA
jgi:hypothetical protein